jgi:hypothetical protein
MTENQQFFCPRLKIDFYKTAFIFADTIYFSNRLKCVHIAHTQYIPSIFVCELSSKWQRLARWRLVKCSCISRFSSRVLSSSG